RWSLRLPPDAAVRSLVDAARGCPPAPCAICSTEQIMEVFLMKQQIAPYINFQGRAREAMELYQGVLGGNLELFAAGEHGAPRPAEPGERIQHARLSGDGFLLIGSDGHPSYPPTAGDN